jgi:hypothetical protein
VSNATATPKAKTTTTRKAVIKTDPNSPAARAAAGTTAAQKKAAANKAKGKAARKATAAKKAAAVKVSPPKDDTLAPTQVTKALTAQAQKDPRSLTVEQRTAIAAAAVPGLKGKARALWIAEGETPAETVKKSPAAAAGKATGKGKAATSGKATGKGKATTTPRKGKGGPGINDLLRTVLADGPQQMEQLVEAISAARGATPRGTVRAYVKGGVDKGWLKETKKEGVALVA